MDVWTVGLVALIAVGLSVILFGALWDRRRNAKRAAEMLAPPKRDIPRFAPDSPAPHYLSDLQARRAPEPTSPIALSDADRASIARQLKDPRTTRVGSGYASEDFVTDQTSGWAVLDRPAILVCDGPVASMRELLTVAEAAVLADRPLVVAAPEINADVLKTLEVNAIQRRMRVVAVIAGDDDLKAISQASGAASVSRTDLQSGYLDPARLGHCERWVSSAKASFLLSGADRESGT